MASPFARVAVAGGGGTQSSASTPSGSGGGVTFDAIRTDVSDARAGRISLAMLDLIILAMIGFYIYTRNAQGGS